MMMAVPSKTSGDRDDLDMVVRAQKGCRRSNDDLVRHYQRRVSRVAARFFLPGGDRQDIMQEAMAGLAFAIRSFDPGYSRSFHDYAMMCVRNSLVRAIRGANRKKHRILNDAADVSQACSLAGPGATDNQVTARLMLIQLWKHLQKRLTGLEFEVLKLKLEGRSSGEIANAKGYSVKQIENGLFRARSKAREIWDDANSHPPAA